MNTEGYLVPRENAEWNNAEYGHFLRSDNFNFFSIVSINIT